MSLSNFTETSWKAYHQFWIKEQRDRSDDCWSACIYYHWISSTVKIPLEQLTHWLFYSKELFKSKIESNSKTHHCTLGETPPIHSQTSIEDLKILNYYAIITLLCYYHSELHPLPSIEPSYNNTFIPIFFIHIASETPLPHYIFLTESCCGNWTVLK